MLESPKVKEDRAWILAQTQARLQVVGSRPDCDLQAGLPYGRQVATRAWRNNPHFRGDPVAQLGASYVRRTGYRFSVYVSVLLRGASR
jgi:hypothetical protein